MTDELTKAEFCARFVVEMLRLAGVDDDGSIAAYAAETAPTYWDDIDTREEGPEVCGEADISYWEE